MPPGRPREPAAMRFLALVALSMLGICTAIGEGAAGNSQKLLRGSTTKWWRNPESDIAKLSAEEFRKLSGTRLRRTAPNPSFRASRDVSLPDNFDWTPRLNALGCYTDVRNQGVCGGCWAFATLAMVEDRLCLSTNGTVSVQLAPQYSLSCFSDESGCQGGYIDDALNDMSTKGSVLELCFPYADENSDFPPRCPSVSSACREGGGRMAFFFVENGTVRGEIGSDAAKRELFTNGPIVGTMNVFQDLQSYGGGIYECPCRTTAGCDVPFVSSHAVEIVGWGLDAASDTEYWVVKNSWGTTWGENGYFRIDMHSESACLLNDYLTAADPSLRNIDYSEIDENQIDEVTRIVLFSLATMSFVFGLSYFIFSCVYRKDINVYPLTIFTRAIITTSSSGLCLAIALFLPTLLEQSAALCMADAILLQFLSASTSWLFAFFGVSYLQFEICGPSSFRALSFFTFFFSFCVALVGPFVSLFISESVPSIGMCIYDDPLATFVGVSVVRLFAVVLLLVVLVTLCCRTGCCRSGRGPVSASPRAHFSKNEAMKRGFVPTVGFLVLQVPPLITESFHYLDMLTPKWLVLTSLASQAVSGIVLVLLQMISLRLWRLKSFRRNLTMKRIPFIGAWDPTTPPRLSETDYSENEKFLS